VAGSLVALPTKFAFFAPWMRLQPAFVAHAGGVQPWGERVQRRGRPSLSQCRLPQVEVLTEVAGRQVVAERGAAQERGVSRRRRSLGWCRWARRQIRLRGTCAKSAIGKAITQFNNSAVEADKASGRLAGNGTQSILSATIEAPCMNLDAFCPKLCGLHGCSGRAAELRALLAICKQKQRLAARRAQQVLSHRPRGHLRCS